MRDHQKETYREIQKKTDICEKERGQDDEWREKERASKRTNEERQSDREREREDYR